MIRGLLGLSSLPLVGYGGWLLLSRQDLDQLMEAGLWLVAGVVAHDLVISGVVLLGALVVAHLPTASRAPAVVALVVVGSLGLVAIPVLGGFGKIAENPTHLDRPYVTAWVCVVVAAVLVVVLAAVVRSRDKES